MECHVAYGTYLGERPNQEDCLFLNGEIVQAEARCVPSLAIAGEALLFAVCDGMGGHARGEWASRFVCERLRAALEKPPSNPGEVISLLRHIQAAIEREPARNCGTTIAGAVLRGPRALVFNAGDSRVYALSAAGISRVSHDHSLVQTYLDRGEISPGDAFRHPHRNVIEFGIGEVFATAWDTGEREVHCRELTRFPGEILLLCSDGVHDVLAEGEIAALLAGRGPAEHAAALGEALRGRMADNASFIVLTPP